MTADEAEEEPAAEEARLAVSAPVTLENPSAGDDLVLSPDEIAQILRVARDLDAPAGERFALTTSADRLVDHLGDDRLAALEVSPVDGEIEVVEGEVQVTGARQGFELDAAAAADRMLELAAQGEPRVGELPGATLEPDVSAGQLEELGVREEVSSFLNAAWFAGIEIIEFTPHSLYFERYPMGREATLSWGELDVVVENDSPYAILVAGSYTQSSVTFTL